MPDIFDDKDIPDTLNIRVTPKAKSEHIKKETGQDGTVLYKVYVTVVPEDGKANKAVIKLLSKALNIPKSSLEIIKGQTSRDKVIKIIR